MDDFNTAHVMQWARSIRTDAQHIAATAINRNTRGWTTPTSTVAEWTTTLHKSIGGADALLANTSDINSDVANELRALRSDLGRALMVVHP